MIDEFVIPVAGISFEQERQAAAGRAVAGDLVLLELDPENEYDPGAIKFILKREGEEPVQVGFVPKKFNQELGVAIRAGCAVQARVKSTGRNHPADPLGMQVQVQVDYRVDPVK